MAVRRSIPRTCSGLENRPAHRHSDPCYQRHAPWNGRATADGSTDARGTILAPSDSPAAGAWARRLAQVTNARWIPVPGVVSRRRELELAGEHAAAWLLTGLRPERDPDFALLLRHAPCPVLTVPAWAPPPTSVSGVAVVGLDRSEAAREAALAAAALVGMLRSPGRLILVHGCETHPDELAATTPWPQLEARMRVEHHDWLVALADELRAQELRVEVVVRPTFAPELIGGWARRENADFTALGVAGELRSKREPPCRIATRVARSTACPMLTVTVSAGRSRRG